VSEVQVEIGPETIRSYKRLAYETWWAIAEFVDNSSQSFINNRTILEDALKVEGRSFEVLINYDRDNGEMRITDNAMGMSLDEITRAVRIGLPPEDATGRHEFGMGLKTAACWLGDVWSLRTTKLGDGNEYTIEFDVERVASGDPDLRLQTNAVDPNLHYTILTIHKMHQRIQGRLLGRLRENLRSIYRFDTRSGMMHLCWGDEILSYDERLELLRAADGTEYRKDFDFEVEGRRVYGWAGILDAGGRPKAGFAVARRGRLVMGQPDAWRPQSIFGQVAGTNDLVNQRIVGEIHLDDFVVSHTKNQILWQGDELDQIENALLEQFADYKFIAQNRRKTREGPSNTDIDVALATISEALQSPEMTDLLTIEEVPDPAVAEAAFQPLRDAVATNEPDRAYRIGNITVRLYLDSERSVNDPYYLGEYTSADVISVCINTQHRFWSENVSDSKDIFLYAINCIYDALSEWKCMQKMGDLQPDTVKLVKDGFMKQAIKSIE
jgi:Histidine kinase-, DNA gyrase B-, and HSP90-like ATPase